MKWLTKVSMPFIVTKGSTTIQVLGTHFNVNSYDDLEDIKVTLLEGSVKVRNEKAQQVLFDGQQARVIKNGEINLQKNADLEEVMAWKNGLFKFNRASMPEVMRELSRWYDVEVIYEKEIPQIKFAGKMQRSLQLSQVLEILERIGVKFRIEGKKLIVNEPKLK